MSLKLQMTEKCLWYYCQTSPAKTFKIYNSTTTTNNAPYNPGCSSMLCNITYDNNRITINLGGGKTACIIKDDFIRNNCPVITVTVPDDSFSVTDSIKSECIADSVGENRAVINDNHPSWDIITENRTCVLGYLVFEGNKNVDGPVGSIGGSVGVPLGPCTIPTIGPLGNCGKSGDDSRPWTTFVGNTRVDFPIATSNEATKELLRNEWESDMRQMYANIAACENTIPADIANPYPNRTYNVNDIVEGIVPGTCSFNIGTISYPAVSFRAKDTRVESTVGVLVAYYKYSYRRPKNVQDILKGLDVSKKCNEKATQCSVTISRISSNYDTSSCNDSPKCYDTDVNKCTSTDYCCQTNKISYL